MTPHDLSGDKRDENSRTPDGILVHLPGGPPVLTRDAAKALLGILVELTTVETLDGPAEGARHDG